MSPHGNNYNLPSERQQEVTQIVITNLQHERLQAILDVKRWSAIPEELRDGTEEEAIEMAKHRIKVCEAQIDAL